MINLKFFRRKIQKKLLKNGKKRQKKAFLLISVFRPGDRNFGRNVSADFHRNFGRNFGFGRTLEVTVKYKIWRKFNQLLRQKSSNCQDSIPISNWFLPKKRRFFVKIIDSIISIIWKNNRTSIIGKCSNFRLFEYSNRKLYLRCIMCGFLQISMFSLFFHFFFNLLRKGVKMSLPKNNILKVALV